MPTLSSPPCVAYQSILGPFLPCKISFLAISLLLVVNTFTNRVTGPKSNKENSSPELPPQPGQAWRLPGAPFFTFCHFSLAACGFLHGFLRRVAGKFPTWECRAGVLNTSRTPVLATNYPSLQWDETTWSLPAPKAWNRSSGALVHRPTGSQPAFWQSTPSTGRPGNLSGLGWTLKGAGLDHTACLLDLH